MNDSILGLLCFSLLAACGGQSLDGGDAPEVAGAPPAVSIPHPTPIAPGIPAKPDEAELCLYDACADGTLSPRSAACGSAAEATERCRLDAKLVIGDTHLRDASGDGVFSPGEVVHIETGLRNTSSCDQPSLPGVSLQSSYPGVPNEVGYVGMLWNYVMLGGEVWVDSTDVVIPASAAPGTRIDFWLTPRSDFHTECGTRRVLSIVVGAK
jgi:hypothetical protein